MSHDSTAPSDAFVFFGATGDLAYKKIFPALQSLIRRGRLDVPIVGVAKSGWVLDQLVDRARKSVTEYGGLDEAAFAKLVSQLRYVDGDYAERPTFEQIKKELGGATRPLHYLAIPPSMFPAVIEQLADTGLSKQARVVVEKPFGRDLASARALNETILGVFPETSVFRIDHYLGKEAVQNILYFRFANAFLEPISEPPLRRERADHDGRVVRREGARQVLRRDGGHPRRHPEPPPADGELHRDGGAVLDVCRGHP